MVRITMAWCTVCNFDQMVCPKLWLLTNHFLLNAGYNFLLIGLLLIIRQALFINLMTCPADLDMVFISLSTLLTAQNFKHRHCINRQIFQIRTFLTELLSPTRSMSNISMTTA